MANHSVAVIGAGVSGLVCASRVADMGFSVTVFDIGRGPGGRMSQRRESTTDGKLYYFDHGAQYFTVTDATVLQLVQKWEAAGIVAEWKGRFGIYDVCTKTFTPDSVHNKRYVGVPGMNSICAELSQQPGVTAKYAITVAKMDWLEEKLVWDLYDVNGKQLGEFSAVVATDKNMASSRFSAPTPLSGAGLPDLVEKLAGVTSSSIYAVMLTFSHPLSTIPFDCFSITGSNVLAYAARDSSKPGREKLSSGECWVLHSTPEFAEEVIKKCGFKPPSEEIVSNVIDSLVQRFKEIADIPPMFAKTHGWGTAFPKTIIAEQEKCLVDKDKHIVVCGDFCVGPTVECAILSGQSAAEKIQEMLAVPI